MGSTCVLFGFEQQHGGCLWQNNLPNPLRIPAGNAYMKDISRKGCGQDVLLPLLIQQILQSKKQLLYTHLFFSWDINQIIQNLFTFRLGIGVLQWNVCLLLIVSIICTFMKATHELFISWLHRLYQNNVNLSPGHVSFPSGYFGRSLNMKISHQKIHHFYPSEGKP